MERRLTRFRITLHGFCKPCNIIIIIIMDDTPNAISRFLSRRRAFEVCLATTEMDAYFHRAGEHRAFTCPCCGYPTLAERDSYDICELCHWEDDGQDDVEFAPRAGYYKPDDIAGGPNADYSLTEARLNFQQYGHMYRPSDTHAFARANENTDARRALQDVFEALLPAVTPDSYVSAMPQLKASSERT